MAICWTPPKPPGRASMGPRSENRGYDPVGNTQGQGVGGRFNGSTVREPWLWSRPPCRSAETSAASMGPRSENRGYAFTQSCLVPCAALLQWVHGPRTVVMRTVRSTNDRRVCNASMGPRSENRGYVHRRRRCRQRPGRFNGSTVREPWLWTQSQTETDAGAPSFNGSTVREPWLCPKKGECLGLSVAASMGPRSENRGYGLVPHRAGAHHGGLQWVHGPRTVVMPCQTCGASPEHPRFNGSTVREPWLCVLDQHRRLHPAHASMGPRSENRGYEREVECACSSAHGRFNGSTVREPWLCPLEAYDYVPYIIKLQWVHGPRTVVMFHLPWLVRQRPRSFNGSTVREPWL